jgi:GAF domain-containing protein
VSVAPLPAVEAERLKSLESCNVLDTKPEGAVDDLTELAAEILHTPIALVSFVDKDRQWLKPRYGLSAKEAPRDVAFCAHAILQAETFVVEDARRDPRFNDNPLVAGNPSIRFYAGMPLVTPEGHALGTLCVIDRVPRALTPSQFISLQ